MAKFQETEFLEDDTPTGGTFAPKQSTGNSLLDMDVTGLAGRLFPDEDFSDDDDDVDEAQGAADTDGEGSAEGDPEEGAEEGAEADPVQAEDAKPAEDAKAEQPSALKGLFTDAAEGADLTELAAQEITTLRESLNQEKDANDRLAAIFESNPEMTSIVRALDKGASFLEALASAVDLEDVIPDPATDPEGYREYVKGRAMREMQREQSKAERERLEAELTANQNESAKVVETFVADKKLTPEDWTKLGTQIDGFLSEAVKGRISPQLLEVFYKGLNYETATEAARQDGVIAGRNQAVTKIQKQKAGDGLPSPVRKAASGVRATPQTHNDPVRESIRQAATMTPSRFA